MPKSQIITLELLSIAFAGKTKSVDLETESHREARCDHFGAATAIRILYRLKSHKTLLHRGAVGALLRSHSCALYENGLPLISL